MLLTSILGAPPANALGITVKRNDYNRDGISDIVGIDQSGCLYRWFGNGNGGFGTGQRVGCGWGPYNVSLTSVGDINRDGTGDLAAINFDDGCLYRWTGNGNGGFNAGTRVGCGWGPYHDTGALTGAGDINRDGNGDLVGINANDSCLYRWTGNGNAGFNAGTRVGCGWGAYDIAGMGDINRDGNGDLLGVNLNILDGDNFGCLYRWLGNGNSGFGTGQRVGCGWEPFFAID